MTEIDVPVIGGPWAPAKDFFNRVQKAIDNSHEHENSDELNKVDSEMLENIEKNTAFRKRLSERPTGSITVSSAEGYINTNNIPNGFVIGDSYNMKAYDDILKVGTEIKSIEVKLPSDKDWTNINEIYTVDSVPVQVSMSKVFISAYGYATYAIVQGWEPNYICNKVDSYDEVLIRITYYTD